MVSVIVPVYNAENCLNNCVTSIVSQTYSEFELILVDDGSSDNSGKLCDEYAEKDHRIRVIHQKNNGVSSARNAGINAAKGDFITFCDSDDFLEKDYLTALIRAANSHPECLHIWCNFQAVTNYQKQNQRINNIGSDDFRIYQLADYMSLHDVCLDTMPWNKLFRTDIIERFHIRFEENLSLGEDWMFNLSYLDQSGEMQIGIIPEPLYNYCDSNENSLDHKYRADLLEIYQHLNNACLYYLQKWELDEKQLIKFYNSRFFMYEKLLRNTMLGPTMSKKEKVKWNSAFMSGTVFSEALNMRDCYINPLYLRAYQSGDYRKVMWLDKLCSIKRALMNRG